ncbi:unnamed protein product [Porites lobata]|uniref:Uncharacterized protein n=1 Tax=Porites lobata TaxID=104759 RepID=A0ABN8SC08_9CNID|nr:unnamed protein product [Porites lobata]
MPGEVPVTVVTDAGLKIGMTVFRHIDVIGEIVREVVKDPTPRSLWSAICLEEQGFFENESNIAQVVAPKYTRPSSNETPAISESSSATSLHPKPMFKNLLTWSSVLKLDKQGQNTITRGCCSSQWP